MEFHETNTLGWFTVLLTSVTETGTVGKETATEWALTGTKEGYKIDIKKIRNILQSRNMLITNVQLYEFTYYLSF
jgi:hypothetical protein